MVPDEGSGREDVMERLGWESLSHLTAGSPVFWRRGSSGFPPFLSSLTTLLPFFHSATYEMIFFFPVGGRGGLDFLRARLFSGSPGRLA